jgi:glycosyltransferase involved in cell wall biosynthesis/GT2 family glycosyltransferase
MTSESVGLSVLRLSHSSVVSAWRERDRELRKLGLRVTLVTAERWDEGGQVVTTERGEDAFLVQAPTFGSHPNLFVYDPRPIWRLLRHRDWNIMDLQEEPCSAVVAEVLLLRVFARCSLPFVLYSAQNIRKRYPIPFRWMERYALTRASGCYVCNARAGDILRDKGLRGIVRVLPLGIDHRYLESAADREPPRECLHVGYVGRLVEEKGAAVLLEAAALDGRLEVEIIGSGPAAGALRDEVSRLGIADRVSFTGHLDQASVMSSYQRFDVLAVPSLPGPAWTEQFGRVAVEAMACGVPVVASDTGSLPEVIGGGGLTVPPGDPTALGRALGRILDDPNLWLELRNQALAQASGFSWRSIAGEQRRFYFEALGVSCVGGRGPGTGRWGDLSCRDKSDGTLPGLEVVIVGYGDPSLLEHCLGELGGEFPVTVVDNSSSDGMRGICEVYNARYLDPGGNIGFAAGVNRALARVDTGERDVLLLNPDATVTPAAVRELQVALHSEPELACVAPSQRRTPHDPAAVVAWPFPTPVGAWVSALGLSRLVPREDFLIGSVLLIKGPALADVGLFDERYFLYAEETDWQRRAKRLGWRTRYCPEINALHLGHATEPDSLRTELRSLSGTERYIRKWHGSFGWTVFRAGVVFGCVLRIFLAQGDRRKAARRRLSILLRGPNRTALRSGVVPPWSGEGIPERDSGRGGPGYGESYHSPSRHAGPR